MPIDVYTLTILLPTMANVARMSHFERFRVLSANNARRGTHINRRRFAALLQRLALNTGSPPAIIEIEAF